MLEESPYLWGYQNYFHLCDPLQSISAGMHSVPRIATRVISSDSSTRTPFHRHMLREATDGELSGAPLVVISQTAN